ncbi:phosphatase PAP2 family protein [Legionella erythra]|uniref:undecaprenyl-diphosphate phosphatase n=1 Tax=Legionella erythra TaxID=448 RepID=A0A0W0TJK8_LEGER|nr:phosphatase PAP2 family protein [Legionella erythra]KTC95796.1 putative membrane-associated phospholipid phosphatase [Legionella erythra]
MPFERLFKVMTKPWVMLLYALLVVVCYLYVDKPVAHFLWLSHLSKQFPPLVWFTHAGLGAAYFILFFMAGVFFRYIVINPVWQIRAWFMLANTLFASAICGVLKVLLGRARPKMWLNDNLYGFYGWKLDAHFLSFPSGHTTTIMSVVLALSILFPRHWLALILTGMLVAFSRILLVHHYISDVLAASYLTLLEVGFVYYVFRKKSWLLPALQDENDKSGRVMRQFGVKNG